MSNNAVLFDLDGTLIDTLGDICGHINHICRDYGLPEKTISELRPFVGMGVNYLAEGAFPELSQAEHLDIVARFRRYYLECPHVDGAPYPGVPETLRILGFRPGIQMAVVTNKLSTVAEKTISHYLPDVHFSMIAGPDRVTARKPNPVHLLEVLGRLSCSPEKAWFVGDHAVDLQCAEAAGVRFLGAVYGFGGVEVDESRKLVSFPDLLEKINFI